MKSLTTVDFWEAYIKLPLDVREQAQKAYRLWQDNQQHPSLHFKKVGKNLWSARVTGGYRSFSFKKG